MAGVQVNQAQRPGATAPAGGFRVQPQQQGIEHDIVAAGTRHQVDVLQFLGREVPGGDWAAGAA
ncbi:hypothetical protein [Micromonospora marina]|uniref:hypothetical protein n=1 Tax=Micromonospora marina TaxID=307120 RepID=UPI003D70FD67